jgi:hydrogenase maturation protease
MSKVLLIGYGNPGRLDDGLGPALAAAVETKKLPGVTVDSDYQLMIEDAAGMKDYDVVIFADADLNGPEPFHFTRIKPLEEISFSTHSLTPESLLGLARKHFSSNTEGFALGIRGYDFDDFGESLSDKADSNLKQAIKFVAELVATGNYDEAEKDFSK